MGKIERHKRGDSVQLSRFIDQYYPIIQGIRKRSWTTEYYDWKYETNPYGQPIVWHYWKDGEILGTFGAIPTPLAIRGEKIIGYQLVDAYIAPHMRGEGIFSKLADIVFNEIDENSAISFGMGPSHFSLPIFTKKYMAYTGPMYRQLFNAIDSKSCINAMGLRRLDRCGKIIDHIKYYMCKNHNIKVREVKMFDSSVTMDINEKIDFAVLKDMEYVLYRYVQCPESYRYFVTTSSGVQTAFIVKIVNWRHMKVCFIVDVLGDCKTKQNTNYILQASVAIANSSSSELLSIEMPIKHADWKQYLVHVYIPHRRCECIFLRQKDWPFLNPMSLDYDESRWGLYTGDSDHI
jgi:GNAT superfamily N-acetyltransferase